MYDKTLPTEPEIILTITILTIAALRGAWRAELHVGDASHILVLPARRQLQLLARLVVGVGVGVLRALRLDLLPLPDRRLPQLWAALVANWRQRLAGVECAVARLLVRVPRLDACESPANDFWVRSSPTAAEAANCSAVNCLGMEGTSNPRRLFSAVGLTCLWDSTCGALHGPRTWR